VQEKSVFGQQSDFAFAIRAYSPMFAVFISNDIDRFKNCAADTFDLNSIDVVEHDCHLPCILYLSTKGTRQKTKVKTIQYLPIKWPLNLKQTNENLLIRILHCKKLAKTGSTGQILSIQCDYQQNQLAIFARSNHCFLIIIKKTCRHVKAGDAYFCSTTRQPTKWRIYHAPGSTL